MPKGVYVKSETHKQKLRDNLLKVRYKRPITTNIVNLIKLRKEKKECNRCGSINNLQLHHIKPAQYDKSNKNYIRGNHHNNNIEVLCSSCHQKEHYRTLSRKKYNNRNYITGKYVKKNAY